MARQKRSTPMRTKSTTTKGDEEPAAVWVPTSELKPFGGNPKVHKIADVRKLEDSIQRFGFGAPILARTSTKEIIGGHKRFAAALRLGMERVPVRFMDLSADEAHVLAMADNEHATLSRNDKTRLATLMKGLADKGVNVILGTGFKPDTVDAILGKKTEGILELDATGENRTVLKLTVVVEVESKAAQKKLIEALQAEGRVCRAGTA